MKVIFIDIDRTADINNLLHNKYNYDHSFSNFEHSKLENLILLGSKNQKVYSKTKPNFYLGLLIDVKLKNKWHVYKDHLFTFFNAEISQTIRLKT